MPRTSAGTRNNSDNMLAKISESKAVEVVVEGVAKVTKVAAVRRKRASVVGLHNLCIQ